jgi:hypothetical protein
MRLSSLPTKFRFLSGSTQDIVFKDIIGSGILRFEVFTETVMKIIFWDIALCSPLTVNRLPKENIASISR